MTLGITSDKKLAAREAYATRLADALAKAQAQADARVFVTPEPGFEFFDDLDDAARRYGLPEARLGVSYEFAHAGHAGMRGIQVGSVAFMRSHMSKGRIMARYAPPGDKTYSAA